jgi:nucleoside-diphosphate-sugar epimerase
MLVLIAGITGNLGKHLALAALSRGFSVRGLGRNPEKLDPDIRAQLESFVTSKSYDDIPALDKAVSSPVEAVICAYTADAVLTLEGNLLLLRAAERAGIKIFHPSTWNADWKRLYEWGEFEHYDTHMAFQRHVEMTSSIKPVNVFSGLFGEALFHPFGPGSFTKDEAGNVSVQIWGSADVKWGYTSMSDMARFSIDLLTRKEVQEGKGGFFSIKGGDATPRDIAEVYIMVRGVAVEVKQMGTIDDLRQRVEQAGQMQDSVPNGPLIYLGMRSLWFGYQGKIQVSSDAETTINGKPTMKIEDILREHPEF